VPGLEVDSFVHQVRTFDRYFPACSKVDRSEAIFICTLMQVVLAYRWLKYGFPANFCVRVSHFLTIWLNFEPTRKAVSNS
jgi:hypothetical protein